LISVTLGSVHFVKVWPSNPRAGKLARLERGITAAMAGSGGIRDAATLEAMPPDSRRGGSIGPRNSNEREAGAEVSAGAISAMGQASSNPANTRPRPGPESATRGTGWRISLFASAIFKLDQYPDFRADRPEDGPKSGAGAVLGLGIGASNITRFPQTTRIGMCRIAAARL
jgi:hypothetical protein